MHGCASISGANQSVHQVTYQNPLITAPSTYQNTFQGPVSWFGCHFEVFGPLGTTTASSGEDDNNVIHYLEGSGNNCYFFGINSYGGNYAVAGGTAVLDYNRTTGFAYNTTTGEYPILVSSTWTTPSVPDFTGYILAYCGTMEYSNFAMKPSTAATCTLSLCATDSLNTTTVDVPNFQGGPVGSTSAFANCGFTQYASAEPTTGTYLVGQRVLNSVPASGTTTGWCCTSAGSLGMLSGVNGTINSGSNILAILTGISSLSEGMLITIGGISGNYLIKKIALLNLNGTALGQPLCYLHQNAVASAANATISFYAGAALTPQANL